MLDESNHTQRRLRYSFTRWLKMTIGNRGGREGEEGGRSGRGNYIEDYQKSFLVVDKNDKRGPRKPSIRQASFTCHV
jgi:hypothetical protein